MSKKSKSGSVVRVGTVRPGEGHPIHVTRTQEIGVDGRTTAVMQGNIANAPVPDRKYVADGYEVLVKEGSVRILFVQKKVVGDGLRSLLEIHLGSKAVEHFNSSLPTGKDRPTFEQTAANEGISASPPMHIAEEPAQSVALIANAIYAAFSSGDACMDFYQISPASIHAARQTSTVGVDPVVRVDLQTSKFLGLCNELKKIESTNLQLKSSKSPS